MKRKHTDAIGKALRDRRPNPRLVNSSNVYDHGRILEWNGMVSAIGETLDSFHLPWFNRRKWEADVYSKEDN